MINDQPVKRWIRPSSILDYPLICMFLVCLFLCVVCFLFSLTITVWRWSWWERSEPSRDFCAGVAGKDTCRNGIPTNGESRDSGSSSQTPAVWFCRELVQLLLIFLNSGKINTEIDICDCIKKLSTSSEHRVNIIQKYIAKKEK